MDRELEGIFPSGCFLFQLWGCPASALAVAGLGGSVLRAHPFFGTVAWCLFKTLLFPSYTTRCRYDVPGVLASGSCLAASACSCACGRCLRIALGPGAGFPFVSLPCGRVVWWVSAWWSFPLPWADVSHSLHSGWVQSLLRCLYRRVGFSSSSGSVGVTVGSGGAVPRGNFWGSHEGWVFQFSPWFEFCFDFFPVLPWVFSPGVGRGSLSRVWLHRSGRLVASGSSELGAAQSVLSVFSLRRILAFVRCELQSPLVSSLTAARLGLWPYGLAIAALPLVSRPWTGLCWSHLLSLSSVSVCSLFYCASWLAQGYILLLRPFALLLAFWSRVPSGSLLRFLRQVFAMRSPFRVESVSVLDRNEVSSSTFLVFGWSLRNEVTLSGRFCLRSRSEQRLFAHLP